MGEINLSPFFAEVTGSVIGAYASKNVSGEIGSLGGGK